MGLKFSELPASSGLAAADLFAVTDDPSGTAASQKLTGTQLLAYVQTSKLSDFATTTSAELASAITEGRTGTGALVCATTPTLVTPDIGAATGTSLTLTGAGTFADIVLYDDNPNADSNLDLTSNGTGNQLFRFYDETPAINFQFGRTENNGSIDLYNYIASETHISCALSGGTGIGGSPAASAMLGITSTTKGFLPPVQTTTQRDAISSPATGLEVYNTTLNTKDVYTGAGWESAFMQGRSLSAGLSSFSNQMSIDLGAASNFSQIKVLSNSLGSFSVQNLGAGNVSIGFDVDRSSGAFTARDTSAALWYKGGANADKMALFGDTGLTVDNTYSPTTLVTFDLSTGDMVSIGDIKAVDFELDGALNHDGSTAGFFGTAPVTQRAKADYNNWAAFGDVVDALVALGLFDAA